MCQYLKDRKGFKKYEVLEGKKTLTTPTHSETYSTVTDLAKFLGMSTSHPLRTAR